MKIKLIVMIVLVAVLVTGCVSLSSPLAHIKFFPTNGQYEILGQVSVTGNAFMFLVFGPKGGVTYADLKQEAEKKYGSLVDDVVNIASDQKIQFFFGLFSKWTVTLHGTAIRFIGDSVVRKIEKPDLSETDFSPATE